MNLSRWMAARPPLGGKIEGESTHGQAVTYGYVDLSVLCRTARPVLAALAIRPQASHARTGIPWDVARVSRRPPFLFGTVACAAGNGFAVRIPGLRIGEDFRKKAAIRPRYSRSAWRQMLGCAGLVNTRVFVYIEKHIISIAHDTGEVCFLFCTDGTAAFNWMRPVQLKIIPD